MLLTFTPKDRTQGRQGSIQNLSQIYSAGALSNLAHDALERSVGADPAPGGADAVERQRLLDAFLGPRRRLLQPNGARFFCDRTGPVPVRPAVLAGMNGLEHVQDHAQMLARLHPEQVAGEVHRTPLPLGVREVLGRRLGQAHAGIRDDQPHALQAPMSSDI